MIIKITKWGQTTDETVLINTDHIVTVQPFRNTNLKGEGSQIIMSNGERFVTPSHVDHVYKLLDGE